VILQVDPLSSTISGQEYAHWRFRRTRLKGRLNPLRILLAHSSVQSEQAIPFRETFCSKQTKEPFLSGTVFGENQGSLVVPLATGLNHTVEPLYEPFCFGICPRGGFAGKISESCEYVPFFGGEGAEHSARHIHGLSRHFFIVVVIGIVVLHAVQLATENSE
jgi:hypothetical protein